MREFVSSFMSYCLANTLYTAQQAGKMFGAPAGIVEPKNPPGPGPEAKTPSSLSGQLYLNTRRTIEKFGDPAAASFIALDEYFSKNVDFVFDFFSSGKRYKPYWSNFPGQVLDQAKLAAAAIGPDQKIHLRQAENTRYIFMLVRNNPEKLGIPKHGEFDLAFYMDKAYGIGDFENIWSVEGLGHVYSQRTWILKFDAGDDAHGIMTDGQAAHMPEKSLTMMHAGLGLAFAESLMKRLTPASSTLEVEGVLKAFIKLCNNNSREGYVGCALESLGLVTRCFNYPLVDLVQQVLEDVDPLAWEFFWRGAGRALYFSPGHMLQPLFSPWIAAEMEAPNERAFKILKAGISWPTNIVNMRQPEIFEDLIVRRGAQEESEGTIRHGVAASTTMALDITPHHPLVMEYLDYKPKSTDDKVLDRWEKLVREPVYRAIHRYQPVLRKHKMMDQVFRFQDLDDLVDRLEPNQPEGETSRDRHDRRQPHRSSGSADN
jgi:hypothetical protein